MLRHVGQRRRLLRHHVRVEVGRTAHGLAGVVDDEVEPRPRGQQLAAERLDARRVTQVETEHLEAVAPLGEVGLLGVAAGGVAGEARGDDEVRAGAQQLQPGLVADLHAAAGEQRHASAQVGQLGALAEVELRARRAQLVVEMVDDGVLLLADVAVQRLDRPRARVSSACTSFGSKPSGGNTLGVVNTGRRRSARMPVSFNTRSSVFSRATFCWRAVALARRRSARASGLCTFDTARRKRLRSASGSEPKAAADPARRRRARRPRPRAPRARARAIPAACGWRTWLKRTASRWDPPRTPASALLCWLSSLPVRAGRSAGAASARPTARSGAARRA